jgi:putative oxidoreductase
MNRFSNVRFGGKRLDSNAGKVMIERIQAAVAPYLLSLLRIVVGLLFLEHGTAKFLTFPHVAGFDNLTMFSLPWFGGVLELVGGILLVLGLGTPLVAFILAGEMAIAYFIAHASRNFFPILNQGEGAVLYCFVFLYLAAAGGGPVSVDAVLSASHRSEPRAA